MKILGLLMILPLLSAGCDSRQEKGRSYLYDLQVLEQARWHVDRLTPIPDSFVTVVTVQARRGTPTSYNWSVYGREKFVQKTQNPTDTLSTQVSDSLYLLTQRIFAIIPTESDQDNSTTVPSDIIAGKVELSTINNTSKVSITTVGYEQNRVQLILFLLRHSRKP